MKICSVNLGFAVLLALAAASLALAQQATPPLAPASEETVARVSSSVTLILAGNGQSSPSPVGSGVIVRPDGVLLTPYHLVKNAKQVQVQLKSGEIFDQAELLAADERRDIAALRVTGHNLPAIAVAPEEAAPGAAVYMISHPAGPSWTAVPGILDTTRLADEVPGAGSGYRLLQFTLTGPPGSSGGVLVDAKGQALGIVTGTEPAGKLHSAVPMQSAIGLADKTGGPTFGAGTSAAAAGTAGANSETAPAPPKSQSKDLREIARSARAFYIKATEAFPPEPLEKKLFEEQEFKSGQFLIVPSADRADVVIEVSRKELTWDFTYRMIHQESGIVLGSGKVIAWDGVRAAPGIAEQIMQRLRQLRGEPAQKKS